VTTRQERTGNAILACSPVASPRKNPSPAAGPPRVQVRLHQEVSRRDRTEKPLSIIMLDIDHFKRFNDNYGHQEGDRILKELAGVIKSQCRHTTMDMCFRYGGEEFSIILAELEMNIALKVAERIRKVVERHPFSIKGRSPTRP